MGNMQSKSSESAEQRPGMPSKVQKHTAFVVYRLTDLVDHNACRIARIAEHRLQAADLQTASIPPGPKARRLYNGHLAVNIIDALLRAVLACSLIGETNKHEVHRRLPSVRKTMSYPLRSEPIDLSSIAGANRERLHCTA